MTVSVGGSTSVDEMIEVLQAYKEGRAIECRLEGSLQGWRITNYSVWDFPSYDYRVQPLTKPSIAWDHVLADYNWLARDSNGWCYIYRSKPTIGSLCWVCIDGGRKVTDLFNSLYPGTCSWKDSLVERPGV